MEWFFLLAGTDFLIVIFYFSVLSRLLLVVPFESFIKEFMVDLFDVFIAIIYIQVGTLTVHILRPKLAAIVIN